MWLKFSERIWLLFFSFHHPYDYATDLLPVPVLPVLTSHLYILTKTECKEWRNTSLTPYRLVSFDHPHLPLMQGSPLLGRITRPTKHWTSDRCADDVDIGSVCPWSILNIYTMFKLVPQFQHPTITQLWRHYDAQHFHFRPGPFFGCHVDIYDRCR